MNRALQLPEQKGWPLPLVVLSFLLILITIYATLSTSAKHTSLSIEASMQQRIGIEASTEVYQAAIASAAKNLAQELDIDLDIYDITEEDYQALIEAAASKFGNCHQYRLYVLSPNLYSCYTCHSKPRIWLQGGQTFKIGQTCNGQKARYGSSLPEPGLKYFIEYEGSIFDVLVAEYVKLFLFRSSKERDAIIKHNALSATELQLPPGNKILK